MCVKYDKVGRREGSETRGGGGRGVVGDSDRFPVLRGPSILSDLRDRDFPQKILSSTVSKFVT